MPQIECVYTDVSQALAKNTAPVSRNINLRVNKTDMDAPKTMQSTIMASPIKTKKLDAFS